MNDGIERTILQMAMCALLNVLFVTNATAQVFEYSGEETFQRFCASCHGEEGVGNGPVAAGLPITVPDLTLLREHRGGEFRALALRRIVDGRDAVIYHGTRFMPVWGYEFWIEEGADDAAKLRVDTIVANLIDYIESIQRTTSDECDGCSAD
jgi:mono/diheme cytochrome c family protein